MPRNWPRFLRWYGGAIFVWIALSCAVAMSEPLRFGVHPGFDRLVAELPESASYTSRLDGSRLSIMADGLGVVLPLPSAGRRIRDISGRQGVLSLSVPPYARRRIWRSGDRLVIDVFEPSVEPAAASAVPALPPTDAPPKLKRSEVSPVQAARTTSSVNMTPAALAKVSVSIPALSAGPAAARSVSPPPPPADLARPGSAGAGASLQFEAADDEFPQGSLLVVAPQEVGAAAFTRNGIAHVVFDSNLPLDLGVLKDNPAYGATTADPLATAAHLLLKPPEGMRLRLLRQKEGWRLGFSRQDQKQDCIAITAQRGGLAFDAPSSGSTLVIEDRQSGATLLIGTQRKGGAHVAADRRTPEFALQATLLGVVVDTVSDRLELHADAHGFTLRPGSGQEVATSWPGSAEAAASEAASLTRRFDFPDLPVPMLRNRLHDAMRDEAQAPTLGRHEARLHTAQAMLALGMDVEALALLRAAASDDPASETQDGIALQAIAAGLAGLTKIPDTRGLPPPLAAAGPTDEDAFWQAALRIPGPDEAQTAATLAATWKLALSYPEPLRRVLLPRVADTLLHGDQTQAAAELLKAVPSPDLDLARAELARMNNRSDEALAVLDRVARTTDRDQRAKARREATELRLANHLMSPKEGAKALQSQVFAWRGDNRELDLRLRVAALLEQSGAWRSALGALRDAEQLYPEAHDRLHEAQASLVRDLLKQDAASTMPPLELVALVGECADLLGESEAGAVLAPVLVDKLLALDLPDRAEPILRRMIKTAPVAGAKAELGLRLAQLLLAKGDAPGASSALEATSASDLTPDLVSRRTLFKARLLTSIGDKDGALHLLGSSDAPEALDQKAALLEQQRDWAGAMAALAMTMGQRISASGRLSSAEADLVLRYASDAAQAGDTAALRKLHDDDGPRMPQGSQADLLRVLTQTPVHAVDDLPRAGQELAVARALPASFAGLQSR